MVWEEEREEIESDGQSRAEGGGIMVRERQRDRKREEGRRFSGWRWRLRGNERRFDATDDLLIH